MREQLTRKDSEPLRTAGRLHDPHHPGWLLVPADIREQGCQAHEILTADD